MGRNSRSQIMKGYEHKGRAESQSTDDMEKEDWTDVKALLKGKEFPDLLDFPNILPQPHYTSPWHHTHPHCCSGQVVHFICSAGFLYFPVLVIKLSSLIAFCILFCDSAAGTQQTTFLLGSCLLLDSAHEQGERLEEEEGKMLPPFSCCSCQCHIRNDS